MGYLFGNNFMEIKGGRQTKNRESANNSGKKVAEKN